jgi:hypothetical protein
MVIVTHGSWKPCRNCTTGMISISMHSMIIWQFLISFRGWENDRMGLIELCLMSRSS